MNKQLEEWYNQGCPKGWKAIIWIFRAGLCESLIYWALRICPENYETSFDQYIDTIFNQYKTLRDQQIAQISKDSSFHIKNANSV